MSNPKRGASIAFIGLGMMGAPMSANLLRAGYRARGADLSEAARAALTANGGEAFASAADAAAGCDVIITMLPNGQIVRDSLLGPHGALSKAPPGALIIDMSSSAPLETRSLGADLAARGFRLVDAPVSGGVKRAVDAALTIMAGGAAADVDAAEPYLGAMGSKIFRTGALGSGHAMKVLNNFVSAAGAMATMEALVLGREFGLDQHVMTDILNASTGKNNTTEVKVKNFILSQSWGSGFAMALMSKDVGIAAELAKQLHLQMDTLALTSTIWNAATASLGKGADHTEIYRYIDQHAHD